MNKIPRIHILSESARGGSNFEGNGVHTAFVDSVDLLRSGQDVEVVINDEGWGDILHAHTYGPYYYQIGRRYKGRKILTVHVIPESFKGTLWVYTLLYPLVRLYMYLAYSYADVCIAISPAVEDTLRKFRIKSRIVRIYNPIHTEKFQYSPERRALGRQWLGLGENDFVVMSAGQVHNRKGVENFLDMAETCPEFTFIWAGARPFGRMTEGSQRITRRLQAAGPHVRFIGKVELGSMPLVYNAADLFVFPSHQENCPLAPLEAAAAGLPVIFRDLPEYAQLYEKPYLKARDTAEFCRFIRQMAGDTEFRRHGQALSKNLLLQFSKEEIREKLIALYREVLGNPEVADPNACKIKLSPKECG
jgi:1,2-diacylglycerol-3-alpha-glucose alpha-1,2-galactosyltransferase